MWPFREKIPPVFFVQKPLSQESYSVLQRLNSEWTEEKYCKNEFALNAIGEIVSPIAETAVQWCVKGYVSKLLGQEDGHYFSRYEIGQYLDAMSLHLYNEYDTASVNNGRDGYANTKRVIETALRNAVVVSIETP